MKPAVWAALLLCACTSNFGDREHQFLRYSGLTKTSTDYLALAQRERFSKVLKHPYYLYCLRLRSPCPDLCSSPINPAIQNAV
ncbi:putative secreted protein [Neisseria meningitidis]|nr:putative secreted protein [Neisseria meningitidis]